MTITSSILQKPKRTQLSNDTSRNVNSILSPNVYDYGRSSINPFELERDTTSRMHTININKSNASTPMSYQDVARNTMKQTTVELNDTIRNINTTRKNDSNTGMTTWDPKTTQKETLLYEHKGQANKKDGMGYVVSNYDAKTTNKETTLHENYIPHANDNNKSSMIYSTFQDPIKVRYAVHAENYKGAGNYYTSNTLNRDQYSNANISNIKEQSVIINDGQTYRGTNSSLRKITNNNPGVLKSTDNLLLKEQYNYHTQNFSNISNVIPNQAIYGSNTQLFHNQNSQFDMFNGNNNGSNFNRFNARDINTQLHDNPFYNLKRT